MNRILVGVAGLAMAASTASAAFLGLEIREDKNLPPADGLAGFPGAARVRVFNFYAKFDGGAGDNLINTVLSVGQPDSTSGFGINLTKNPGSNFYRSPGAAGGSNNGVGGINLAGAGDNRRFWNSFVSVGVKSYDGDYGPIYSDATSADPDYAFQDRDGVGAPALQAADFITGGWFNSNPPGLQGAPVFNPSKGNWETFLANVAVIDVTGAALWDGDGDNLPDPAPNHVGPGGTWFGDIFEGQITVFRQGDQGAEEPPAVGFTMFFGQIPTPGALALFGVAGLAAARRRR